MPEETVVLLLYRRFNFFILICIHFSALVSKISARYNYAPVNCFLEDKMESGELSKLICRIKTFEVILLKIEDCKHSYSSTKAGQSSKLIVLFNRNTIFIQVSAAVHDNIVKTSQSVCHCNYY